MSGSRRDAKIAANNTTQHRAAAENADESTPLLLGGGELAAATADPGLSEATTLNEQVADGDDKPLPKMQIALLCFARFIEPASFFVIFPYINQMVQENGNLDDADVGFYSGLIESLFSLTQMVVMIFWGKAADRLGRKPVLICSLAGVTVATSVFGMAKTIWQMVLFRCLAGVFAGSIVTIRTMISEHSTSKTQARAFSWFMFTNTLGIFFGSLIGGPLADPANQYPTLFKNIRFFNDFPYALPSLFIGLFSLTAVILTTLFVEETLVKKPSNGDNSDHAVVKPPLPSTWQLLQSPGVGIALYAYGHVMLLAFAYTAMVPVLFFTPVPLGGFGLAPLQISLLMAVGGLSQAAWTLIIFPPLQHRVGTRGVLRVCAIAYPLFFAGIPLFNVLLRVDTPGAVTAFWVVIPVALAIASGISMSFTAVQLALNDVSPSPQVLGTLNALALTAASGIRAFSPALFTSLFAVGARTQWVWGYFVWVIMVVLAAAWTAVSGYMPDYDKLRETRERENLEQRD